MGRCASNVNYEMGRHFKKNTAYPFLETRDHCKNGFQLTSFRYVHVSVHTGSREVSSKCYT